MKRKVVSVLLIAAMSVGMLAGCGDKKAAADNGESSKAGTTESVASNAGDAAEEDGKVLNIYCWNEEFKSRITDHYPGYEKVDATHGTIGDVKVVWNITPNDDNAYQNNLDTTLLAQESMAANDKIDIFLVEADYALKYVGGRGSWYYRCGSCKSVSVYERRCYRFQRKFKGRFMAGMSGSIIL